jgi:hypothetical protein
MLPPSLGKDVLLLGAHGAVSLDDVSGLDASRNPDFFLILLEVSLLGTFTFEVEIEPFKELAIIYQKIR